MILDVTRRQLGSLLLGAALPGVARAQARKDTLILGLSISDTVTFDPARQANYSPPLTLAAAYDTLVTLAPGTYTSPGPLLATSWARTQDGLGWRFTLRPDARFSTGRTAAPEDVAFSLNRVLAIGGLAASVLEAVTSVTASGADTVDLRLKAPETPILGILASPSFAIIDRQALQALDGADRAVAWLNENSAGTGPYVLTKWTRNLRIELAANPYSWRGPSAFQRITILHMPDGAAQLQALRRGEIDVAFNLIPEQIVALQSERAVRVESLTSLDFAYLALTSNPELNQALAVKQARQAIGCAIDYDGVIGRLLGGKAVRPAHFLPIGVHGSTETVARQVGFHQDLDRARRLLAEAGLPDGFTFELSYANGAIAGLSYATLAQKLRVDLAQVGIKATLQPLEPGNLRGRYLGGRAQAALAFWNPPAIETRLWATAALERVGPRVGAAPSPELARLVDQAAAEADPGRQLELWVEFQKAMVDAANLIVLFQPVYQVAVRNTVAAFPLTAAGWMADLGAAKPG